MLKYFIEEKHLFNLEELNTRIKNFKYGYRETKPTVIWPTRYSSSNPTDLNQSGIFDIYTLVCTYCTIIIASKMWTLARCMLLLIARNVPQLYIRPLIRGFKHFFSSRVSAPAAYTHRGFIHSTHTITARTFEAINSFLCSLSTAFAPDVTDEDSDGLSTSEGSWP